jgi:hypothetical protein
LVIKRSKIIFKFIDEIIFVHHLKENLTQNCLLNLAQLKLMNWEQILINEESKLQDSSVFGNELRESAFSRHPKCVLHPREFFLGKTCMENLYK